MSLFDSRSKQLADHIRDSIARGELGEPLAGIRAWSKSLGVSSRTLQVALRMLQREGLLVIHPRKVIRLKQNRRRVPREVAASRRIVRFLYYGRQYPRLTFAELPSLAEQFRAHGMEISLERCTHARLKAISRSPPTPHELLFLCSVPAEYHRYFAHMTRNVLILGHPSPGSPLSFIAINLEGAARHAVQSLMRRGFSRISLVIDRGTSHGVTRVIQAFQQTCAEWPHQPIHSNTVRMHVDPESMLLAARRFAVGVRTRQGILVVEPVSVGMIMTALLERGIAIPRQAEIIAISTFRESIMVCPRPIHYPYPVKAAVKGFVDAALHFFETGALPRIHKKLLMEVAPQ